MTTNRTAAASVKITIKVKISAVSPVCTSDRKYCKEQGIRISGPALGRKPKVEALLEKLINTEKQDMIERISVERHFSREKWCFGIEKIVEKTEETIGHAVGMAVFLDNVVPVGF